MSLHRDKELTTKQKEKGMKEDDRKGTGYLGFYEQMLDLLQTVREDYPDTHEKYILMTRKWIKDAR